MNATRPKRRPRARGPLKARRWTTLGATVALATLLAVILPSQASAASSPVVLLANPCPVAVVPANDARPELQAFCKELNSTRSRANPAYEKHYTAATRRRIRRVVASEARRTFGSQPAAAHASPSVTFIQGNFYRLDFLGTVKTFARKAGSALKTVVGGALKFVPQARLINCGLLAGFATVGSLIDGKDLQGVATAAVLGCASSFLPLRTPKKKE